ncbi:MAG: conjugal transfer protein TraH [Gammaproteobacteria bacterium]
MKKIILFFILFFPKILFADVNSDLNNFFDGLGVMTNTTAPHAYQGQQAGYYSGGSVFSRNAVRNFQLVQVDLPSFRAGCGGIDLFAGGFSYINNDQLVALMRNIMNNAKGYGMLLALEEVTPQIGNINKFLTDLSNKVNGMNINSCETAESLVGGVWPRTRAAQQQVCQDIGSNTGIFDDWAKARQGCTSDDLNYNFDSTMRSGAANPQYKNLVLDNGNIAWKALQANNLVNGDQQFAELLMSLSGSIIIQKIGTGKSSKINIANLDSLATSSSLLKAILYGDKATFYKCDEPTQCLNPAKQTVQISQNSALKGQVEKILNSINQKIINDQPLSNQEIGLLQSTRIPIYKILAVQAAYQKDPNILNVENYSEIIAADILFQYLQENLNLVRASSGVLQYPEEIMTKFNNGINQAMTDVREQQKNAQVQVSQAIQLIEQTQVLEKMLSGQLSAEVGNSLTWARSLR